MGSEVVEVFATGAVRIVPELAELGDVDTAVVTLWHENDCITVIDNSRQATYGYDQRIEVLGAEPGRLGEPPGQYRLVRDPTVPGWRRCPTSSSSATPLPTSGNGRRL